MRRKTRIGRKHLADARGWLDARDPFFKTMRQIVKDRLRHRPRGVVKKNRTGTNFRYQFPMPRYTIAYAKNIMRRTIQAVIDAEPTKNEIVQVWEYFKGECAYCGRKLTRETKDAHIDHLVSAALKGGNALSNRVLSCGPCNGNEKRDMPWQDFLQRKNPNRGLFEARRRAILQWQERVAAKKAPRESSKDLVAPLAAAEESVQNFEKACLALREVIQKIRVQSLRGAVIQLWKEADRPGWSANKTMSVLEACDQNFRNKGLNPAPNFRSARIHADRTYMWTWMLGAKFPWMGTRRIG